MNPSAGFCPAGIFIFKGEVKNMQPGSLGIGMDTGGTYTDAVLMDLEKNEVLASVKTPTTHHDLGKCLEKALAALKENPAFHPEKIALVAVSSTLATNSIVEGLGADVGLFVIGLDKHFELPVAGIKQISGGHTILGAEEEPLDLESLLDGVMFFRGRVDTYAVIANMAFVNPGHEKVAAKAISMVDDKPVFCSCEVSGKPGMEERAATTVLNARLMPQMRRFLRDVVQILEDSGLDRNIRVIRGDGKSTDAEEAVLHAVATVASGPAATAWFGAGFAGDKDAIVIDVGGTSTDITCICAGTPLMEKSGSRIGNLDTHVPAISMHTIGIGGDSFVRLERGELLIGPERVRPLAMTGDFPDPCLWMNSTGNQFCVRATGFFETEDPIVGHLMEKGPKAIEELGNELGLPEMVLKDRMAPGIRKGFLEVAGFTPTDALHVLRKLDFGDREKALAGARFFSEKLGISEEAFALEVLRLVSAKIEEALVDFLTRLETGKDFSAIFPQKSAGGLLKILFKLEAPIIGIGAAAKHLLSGVAETLDTELLTPAHYEVGNAIGALCIAANALE